MSMALPHGDVGEGGLVTEFAADPVARGVARWASERACRGLAPAVMAGAGVGLALVAAVWFSDPVPLAKAAAAVALLASFVANRAARVLSACAWPGHGGPGVAWQVRVPAGTPVAGWLMAGCWALSEWAVYAGLAASAGLGVAGAHAAHGAHGAQGAGGSGPGDIWRLAVAAMLLLAIRRMISLCYERAAERAGGRPWGPRPAWLRRPWLRQAGRSLALPAGERVVLVAVAGAVWGPRVTFSALLAWGTLAFGYTLTARIAAARDASASGGDGAVSGANGAVSGGDGGQIAAYRDDGRVSQWLGGLVEGRLPPLPPVIVGVGVTSVLAALGIGHLRGILVLTPVEAMLLAGLGSCHRHDGMLDWLVPPLLQAGEYLFLAALAFTSSVPPPLAFALLAAVALRHLDVAYRARYRVTWPVRGRRADLTGPGGSAYARAGYGPDEGDGVRAWEPGDAEEAPLVALAIRIGHGVRAARRVLTDQPSPASQRASSGQRTPAGQGSPAGQRGPLPGHPAARYPEADWAGLGWELRMLAAGIAGAFGVVTFACVVLSGYLWFLLGWDFLTGWLAIADDDGWPE